MDVVVDFAGFSVGTEIVLRNQNATEPVVPNVMKFVVGTEAGFTDRPARHPAPGDPDPRGLGVTDAALPVHPASRRRAPEGSG